MWQRRVVYGSILTVLCLIRPASAQVLATPMLVSPSSLIFGTGRQGTQCLNIASSAAVTYSTSIAAESGNGSIQASSGANGTTPGVACFTLVALGASDSRGHISVSAGNNSRDIPYLITVVGGGPWLNPYVAPFGPPGPVPGLNNGFSLTFASAPSGTPPPAQCLMVASTPSGLSFTAAVTSPAPDWLQISSGASGTTSASSSVCVSVSGGLSAGTYTGSVTITAPGAFGSPFIVPVTLQVANFTIYPANASNFTYALPSGAVNASYSCYPLTVVDFGGALPITWTYLGGLPAGMNMASDGRICGTPSQAGVFLASVKATDGRNSTATAMFSLFVAGAPTITTPSPLPPGSVNGAYSYPLAATGGNPATSGSPYSWSWSPASGSSLPPGLALSSGGALSGTPSLTGNYTFLVTAADGANATASQQFTLAVASQLSITPPSLPQGIAGGYFSYTLAATGGNPPYTWSTTSALPTGITLSAGGALSGTPSQSGDFPIVFTVKDTSLGGQATATSAAITLHIAQQFTITTASPLPPGSINAAYSYPLTATSGSAPYTWTWSPVSPSSTPAGLTLSAGGAVSGTPSQAADYTVSVTVRDAASNVASKNVTLHIAAQLAISTPACPSGIVNASYSCQLAATGGNSPYTWSTTSALPSGITFSAGGVLSGTPSQSGDFPITFTLKDTSAGGQATKTTNFTLHITPLPIVVTTPPLIGKDGVVGTPSLTATGGTPPYQWSLVSPPSGLTINSATGVLSWAFPTCGLYNLTAQVKDSATPPATVPISWAAAIGPKLTIAALPSLAQPMASSTISVSLTSSCNTAIGGTLSVGFQSAVTGATDPSILFGNGSANTSFTIPASSTTATFTDKNGNLLQTGSVAGTITLTAGSMRFSGSNTDFTPTANSLAGASAKLTPIITSVQAVRSGSGITVTVIGYSTSRELQTANFTFTVLGVGQTPVTVSLVDIANNKWYGTSASIPYGSQFLYTQPFTVTQGNATDVSGVAVVLSNSMGTMPTPFSAQIQ